MCNRPENSLQANKLTAKKTFLAGRLTRSKMIGRIAAAENAERAHKALMESACWTPEELLRITGYRIASDFLK